MKNKQILFILLLIASCSLDAFFFNWNFPSFTTTKKTSLDELVNKELDKVMKETAFIPQCVGRHPSSFHEARHNACREMYINAMLEECEKLQNDKNFKNKPALIHKTAVEKARLAHQEIYVNFDKTWNAARKAKSKDALKERQEEIVKAAIESATQTISKKPAPNKYSPVYYEIRPINNWEDYSAWEREQVIQNRRPLYSQLIYGNKPK